MATGIAIESTSDYFIGRFSAMASPCEVLVDTPDRQQAESLIHLAAQEAWRIEHKFSRYRNDNILHALHQSHGAPLTVCDETAHLLDYAALCYELSQGMFDITSGVLRRVWKFDGSDRVPSGEHVAALLPLIGWSKLRWQRPQLTLPEGMEIDFGGIGKEYAVDRALQLITAHAATPCVVNFGGDLATNGPRHTGQPWIAGIEALATHQAIPARVLHIKSGGLATSGDARRYLNKNGIRYGHILNPHTGWPVQNAPRSVTVAASHCTEAGMLATLAMLHGSNAETFLDQQSLQYWCIRD